MKKKPMTVAEAGKRSWAKRTANMTPEERSALMKKVRRGSKKGKKLTQQK